MLLLHLGTNGTGTTVCRLTMIANNLSAEQIRDMVDLGHEEGGSLFGCQRQAVHPDTAVYILAIARHIVDGWHLLTILTAQDIHEQADLYLITKYLMVQRLQTERRT